jgi:tetratricopeptide (TPR) repeat protein
MKNKNIFSAFLILFMFTTLFVSIKIFQSHYIQAFLMYDFNSDTYNIPYDEFSKFDDDFPNLSGTALPMKFVKARYYLNLDSLEKTKELLYNAIKVNPYVKGPEEMLARVFLKEENYDSAYVYSKEAFDKMPNANPHRYTYFRVLRHFKDSIALDSAFNRIKKYNNPSHWYDYAFSKFKIARSDSSFYNLVNEFKIKFPNEDFKVINQMINYREIGSEAYTLSTLLAKIADEKFEEEEYVDAADMYEKAIDFNPENYLLYENAAISYNLSEKNDKAKDYFDKVIYDFKPTDGRAEFYKGLMLLQSNNVKGCEYLKISSDKRYIGKTTGISAINVFIGLCQNSSSN